MDEFKLVAALEAAFEAEKIAAHNLAAFSGVERKKIYEAARRDTNLARARLTACVAKKGGHDGWRTYKMGEKI